MLADDEGVHVARAHVEVAAEFTLQPRRVERSARANDSVRREARELRRSMREDVDWVRRDNEQRVWRRSSDAGHNICENRIVGPHKLETRLAWLLVHSRSDDDGCGASAVLVGAGADSGPGEVRGVGEIGRLAISAMRVDVDDDNIRGQTTEQKSVGGRCTD